MSKKYFITGTNTDVGKTIISALLCNNLKADYFKPIQTGANEILDANTIKTLTNTKIFDNAYCLKVPSSPAFASEKENIQIKIENINLPNTENNLIVEGAGGCMVPINKNQTTIDLIKHFNIPVIIVVKNELGCVSSALTTITSLRVNNIEIAGVILNGDYDPFDNKKAISHYGNVEVLDIVKHFENIEEVKNYKLSKNLIKKLL